MSSLTTVSQLIDHYDVFLLDALGVLVDADVPLPGARQFLERLHERQKPFFVLTNGASQTIEKTAKRYYDKGLPISSGEMITSGSLLKDYFAANAHVPRQCLMIGDEDCHEVVEWCGGQVLALAHAHTARTFVIMDQKSADLLQVIDVFLSAIIAGLDAGEQIHLIAPNPDLYYPKAKGGFGITAGAIATMIEQALALRYAADLPMMQKIHFVRLGKPHRAIFEAAQLRYGRDQKAIMLGDQLMTDIKGAVDFGIDSCLLGTGITKIPADLRLLSPKPTWVLPSLILTK